MTRPFNSIWLLIFAVWLAVMTSGAGLLPPPPEHEAVAKRKPSSQGAKTQEPRKETSASRQTAMVIPIYAFGNLRVTEKPKPKKNRPKQETRKKTKSLKGGQKPTHPSPHLEGFRPALSVDFSEIGVDHYLRVIARWGRSFALVAADDGSLAVGPEIDLLQATVRPRNDLVMKRLQTKRPHIVRDPGLQARLKNMSLPPGASRDQVIYYHYTWADRALWDAAARAVARHGRKLEEVTTLHGRYRRGGSGGTYLELGSAAGKDGVTVALGSKIWVKL